MTREEAKSIVRGITDKIEATTDIDDWAEFWGFTRDDYEEFLEMPIKLLEQEPCGDAISRQAVLDEAFEVDTKEYGRIDVVGVDVIDALLPVNPQPKTGHCKDCKYFEYDSVAKVDGIPLIVAHEICKRWGDGCKTKEDGYCFMFEPQESEE